MGNYDLEAQAAIDPTYYAKMLQNVCEHQHDALTPSGGGGPAGIP